MRTTGLADSQGHERRRVRLRLRVSACVCVACSFLADAAEDPIPELERALVRQQRGELDVGAGTGAVDDLLKRMTAKQRCVC